MRNPYARQLALPPVVQRQRRANQLYLDVIETVTFYHQYQRHVHYEAKSGQRYIETSIADIEAANTLMCGVLTTKSDELTGACRQFFDAVKAWMRQHDRESFYAGELRQALRLSPSHVQRQLSQLRSYGYLSISGGNRYRRGFEYQVTKLGRHEGLFGDVKRYLAEVLERIKTQGKQGFK